MIKQPTNSKLCGQCCLATILNISLEEAIQLVGHNKGTYYKDLIKHFNHDKIKRGLPPVKALCLIRPREKTNWRGHWILYLGKEDNDCYDPTLGNLINLDIMLEYLNARVVSHINIL